jgi:hypothetical protein
VHLVAAAKDGHRLQDIICDLKKYMGNQILKANVEHPGESRRKWMLWVFRDAGEATRRSSSSGSSITSRSSYRRRGLSHGT